MHRPRRLLLAALVAATFAGAPAAVAYDSPPGSVSNPLEDYLDTSLTDDEHRFVTLWTARFRTGLQAYLDSDVEFDDGFNDRSEDEKHRLVGLLVAHWRTLPGAAEQMEAAKSDPNQMDETDLREIAYQVIFAKREFKAGMRMPESEKTDPAEAPVPTVPEEASPAVRTAEELAALTAQRVAAVLAVFEKDLPAPPAVDTYEPVHVATPPVGPEAENEVADAVDAITAVTAPLVTSIDKLIGAIGVDDPVRLGTAQRMGPLDDIGLTYTPCFQKPASVESCGIPLPVSVYDTTLNPLQLGVPATYDVNGDLLPDVKLEVGVNLLATAGSARVNVKVTKLNANGNLVKATARYKLPSKDSVITAGFDGRTVGLQNTQQVEVEIDNVLGGGTSTDLTATLTHSGYQPTVALVAGFASATSPAALAMSTTTTITRTPSPLTAHLVSQRNAPVTTYTQQFTHGSPALPDVSTAAVATLGATQVHATAGFQNLPTNVTITTTAHDSGRRTIAYTGSSVVTNLATSAKVIPNVAVPGDFFTASANLVSAPTSFTIVTDKLPAQIAQATTGISTFGANTDPDPRLAITYTANTPIQAANGNALDTSFGQYVGNTAKLTAAAGMTSIPMKWQAVLPSKTSRVLTFDSYGAGIAKISASVGFDGGALAQAAVEGFPGRFDLSLPSAGSQRFVWNASGPVSKITADAWIGAYEGHMTITGVPATWTLTLPSSGKASFTAPSAVGSFQAWISTTGGYVTGGAAPNYATFTSAKLSTPKTVRGETITFDMTGAVRFGGIRAVSFEPTATGSKFGFEAGSGGDFLGLLSLDDFSKATRTYARIGLSPFPGKVTGEVGSRVEITTNVNTTLDAEVHTGNTSALASTPAAPFVHGASFRDGISGGGKAFKARVYLTGLPTYALVENGNAHLIGFSPTIPTLEVDYERDNDPANVLRLRAVLAGLPPNGNISMSFTKAATSTGGSTMTATVSATASLGTLTASIDTGALIGTLQTTALPSYMSLTMKEESGTQTYTWNSSAPVARIDGGFLYRNSGTSAVAVRGGVKITDIPAYFTLTLGRDPSGGGALFTYSTGQTGVPAQRLDVEAWADASLTSPNAAVAANLDFILQDLGSYAQLAKNGSELSLTSSGGEIALLQATVSMLGGGKKEWSGKWLDSSWIDIDWKAGVGVAAGVDDLTIKLTRIQSLRLTPGIVSDVSGTFGTFHMSWRNFFAAADAYAGVYAVIDWPSWLASDTYIPIAVVTVPYRAVGNMKLHVFTENWTNLWSKTFDFWVRGYRAYVDIRPSHHSTHNLLRALGGLNLGGATPTYQKYMVTPNPFSNWLPGWAVQIATGVIKYQGGFVNGGIQRLW